MGYFDKPENSIGALTTRLSDDASAIKGATGLCEASGERSGIAYTFGTILFISQKCKHKCTVSTCYGHQFHDYWELGHYERLFEVTGYQN